MKRTRLARRTPLRATKSLQTRKKAPRSRAKPRKRLPALSTLRNRTDALLTPIVKAQSPRCESCGGKTEVAHHWIEKSRSSNLRYDLRNLIALCHSCHARIHNRFGNSVTGAYDVADRIVLKRGREWKETMDRDGRKQVKVNREWYEEHYERLSLYL